MAPAYGFSGVLVGHVTVEVWSNLCVILVCAESSPTTVV